MMGGFDEHIRQFNNYNTIFGTFWFNILCVSCNLIEIITTVVLLGYYHSVITIDYVWWPLIEMIRLFTLTILRFDVMLKGVENYNDNRTGFKYTKRMIILCNLIGFFVILIGAPLYLSLLSTPTNSLYSKSTIYTIFMSIYPSFILIRICLTLPMYCTLLIGTNPIFSINNGYQRIDDGIATHHRRRTRRRRSQGDGYEDEEERESHEERVQRQMRRQWRIMQLEQRQMELAIEQSRRDAFKNTIKEEDKEYERALQEHKEENTMLSQPITSNSEHDIVSPMDMTPLQSDDISDNINNINYNDENDNKAYDMSNAIELDELTQEVEENNECVYIRIRLPNGWRAQRRFHYTNMVKDVILWTQHECKKHNQIHLINHSQLISTHPHTVYNHLNKNLKDLKWWKDNGKGKCVSPTLYVEEL
eukprot:223056_1